MKQKLYFPFFLVLFFFHSSVYGVHSHEAIVCEQDETTPQQFIPLDRVQLESQLGIKLKFKERIALSILKAKVKKSEKKAQNANAEDYYAVTDGFAIAGFVLGILSLLVFGILFGILAIIFSAISLGRIRKFDGLYKGRSLATAGLVMGIIAVALSILVLVLVLAFF